jgi:hypothetical protein
MTTKSDFNADEWATLAEAPLLAGLRLVTAERGGTLRESLSVGRAYAEARREHGKSPLLDELVASPPTLDPSQLREGAGDIATVAGNRIREAAGIADAKAAPDDAKAYREFIFSVAETVANANREGGFAGIGGKPVSEREQAALDEIRAILAEGT